MADKEKGNERGEITQNSANDVAHGKQELGPLSSSRNDKDAKDAAAPPSPKREFEGDVDLDDDVTLTFPQKLMEILDDEANTEIISWLPHGRAFAIIRKKAFEENILPKHFNKQSKYSSFTRKLNRWGFVRVTRGPETGAYYHQYFKRGGHRLCMQMSCQSSNKSAAVKGVTAPNVVGVGQTMSALYPVISLQSAAASGQSIFQTQQQQMAQMQLQQQMLQQDMARRAMVSQMPTSQDNMYTQVMGGRSRGLTPAATVTDPTRLAQLSQTGTSSISMRAGHDGAFGPHCDQTTHFEK